MLPEGVSMKKELRKLVGDDPIESVSIETFEQNAPEKDQDPFLQYQTN